MGTLDVKEDYKKRRLRITPQGWEAETGYTIAYAANEQAAIDALGLTINQGHPLNPLITLQWVGLEEYNFNLSRARALWKQTAGDTTDNTDPLKQPPVMNVTRATEAKQTDRDAFGNPLVVSTGDAITGAHRNFFLRQFTITRNEPYWDPRLDAAYSDTYNVAPFAPLGFPAMEPGQCRCLSILPAGPVTKTMKYVPVVYSFEYAQGVTKDKTGVWDAFMLVQLDAARSGWYDPGTGTPARGHFVGADNNLVQFDVLLDGTGKPIDPTIKIGVNNNGTITPSDPVAAPDAYAAAATIVSLTDPAAKLLVYTMLDPADFNVFGF